MPPFFEKIYETEVIHMRIPIIIAVSILMVIGLFVIDWLITHGGEDQKDETQPTQEEAAHEKDKGHLHDRTGK